MFITDVLTCCTNLYGNSQQEEVCFIDITANGTSSAVYLVLRQSDRA